jgi:hypothetical protein
VSGEGAEALIGALDADSNDVVTDCYFLEGPESSVGTGLTPEEMQMEASFSGWDFDTIWQFNPEISEFPALQFQTAP